MTIAAEFIRHWLYSDDTASEYYHENPADRAEYLHTAIAPYMRNEIRGVYVRVRLADRKGSPCVFGRLVRFARHKGAPFTGRAVVAVPGTRWNARAVEVTVPRDAILAVVPGRFLSPFALSVDPSPVAARVHRDAVADLRYTIGQSGYNVARAVEQLTTAAWAVGESFPAVLGGARNAFLHGAAADGARRAADLIAIVRAIAPDLFAPAPAAPKPAPEAPAPVEVVDAERAEDVDPADPVEAAWEALDTAIDAVRDVDESPALHATREAESIARRKSAAGAASAAVEALAAYDARARAERDAIERTLRAAVAVLEARERRALLTSKGAA